MDTSTLLTVFITIATISVIIIDIVILYMFINDCRRKPHDYHNRELTRPLVINEAASTTDTYYTSL